MEHEIYSRKKATVSLKWFCNSVHLSDGSKFVNASCCVLFSGLCNASVIFGIGKQKFRTELVRDNDPTWNEETVM